MSRSHELGRLSALAAGFVTLSVCSCGDDASSQRAPDASIVDATADGSTVRVTEAAATPLDARTPPDASTSEDTANVSIEAAAADAASSEASAFDGAVDARVTDVVVMDASSSSEAGPSADEAGTPALPATSIAGRFVARPQLFVDVDLDPVGSSDLHNDVMHPVLEERDASQSLSRPAWVVGYLGPMVGKAGAGMPVDAGAPGPSPTEVDIANDAGLDAGLVRDAAPGTNAEAGGEMPDAALPPKLPAGPGVFPGDNVDYYRVSLQRGDVVTLYVFDAPGVPRPPTADLDLYLLSGERWNIAQNGSWMDDSIGTGRVEQVVAPFEGTFWIAVQRYLDVSSDVTAAASYGLAVHVPVGTIARDAIAQGRLSSASHAVDGAALVRVPFGPPSPGLAERLELSIRRDSAGYRRARIRDDRSRTGGADARALAYDIKRLRRDPGVIAAEPELRFRPQGSPIVDDPELGAQWHLWPVDTFGGWEQSERAAAQAMTGALGQGVVVAVVDTGVAFDHPDFRRADGEFQLLQGYDMISDSSTALDGDGRDPYPDDPGDQSGSGGGTFHGTHVAGIIAAASNNGVGVVGTAPDARVLPVRVMGKNGGVLSDVIDGVLYAAGLPNGSGELPERRADIINLSLAGPGRSTALSDAIDQALDAGVIVVAAAGNFSRPVDEYTPAAEPGVITVSALDASLRLARYSNYSVTDGIIDLTAMGGDLTVDRTLDDRGDGVWSLLYRNNGELLYGYIDGTSMAAAQVSGIAALMKGVWPEMGPDDFRALLPQAVIELGDVADPDFGRGLISAPRAVAAAVAAAAEPPVARPVLHVSPRGFDFGQEYDTLPFEIVNTGDAELVIHNVTSDVPWLTVESREPGANRLLLDRWSSQMAWGRREATVTIHSNAGEARLAVRVLRDEFPPEGDVGDIVVTLQDASSGALVAQSLTSAASGYDFRFDDLAPGRYRVSAATRFWSDDVPSDAAFRGQVPLGGAVLCVGVVGDDCADVELADLIGSLLLQLCVDRRDFRLADGAVVEP